MIIFPREKEADELAKYTITLEEARSLMSDEQRDRETEIFSLITNTNYRETFKRAYDLKYIDYEIANGTPLGYLNDFEKHMLYSVNTINAIFSELERDGYFRVTYDELTIVDTETRDLTAVRTPNTTVTSNGTTRFYDTPDTPIPDTPNPDTPDPYEQRFITNLTGSQASTQERGNETNTDEGTVTHNITHTRTLPPKSVYEILKNIPQSVIEELLKPFSHCFMLVF